MSPADFTSLPVDLRNADWLEPFSELSYSTEHHASCIQTGTACGNIQALNFDTIKEHWYGDAFHDQVKSADALYVDKGVWYLVGFKYGGAKAYDVVKKYYDSILGLVEHGCLSWRDCRERLKTVLVWSGATCFDAYDIGKKSGEARCPSWSCFPRDVKNMNANTDFRILLGHFVSDAYVMGIDDFVSFTANEGWQ